MMQVEHWIFQDSFVKHAVWALKSPNEAKGLSTLLVNGGDGGVRVQCDSFTDS